MKVEKIKLLTIIWSISVFSTFIIVKVYPIFFLFFILSFFLLSKKHIFITPFVTKLITFILIFIIIFILSTFHGYIDDSYFHLRQNIKFTISFSWLFTSILFFTYYNKKISSYSSIIDSFFLAIFCFSFIQLFTKIFLLDLWTLPFDGSNTSSATSYVFNEIPVFFGNLNKNIFSTKVIFILIMLIFMRHVNYVKRGKSALLIILGILFTLYALSRTGQVVYFLFIFMLFFRSVYLSKKNIRPILYAFVFILGIVVVRASLISFFHFDISSNADGFAVRLLLWEAYFDGIEEIGLLGKGIHSADPYLKKFGFSEGNFHNVFLNTSYEAGWVGLFFYLSFFFLLFYFQKTKAYPLAWLILFVPFVACVISHYKGYEGDIVVYLANSFNVLFFLKNK